MKRVTRDRCLTPAEADKYNAVRAEIEAEKPEINARIRQRMAEVRKADATQFGGQTVGQRIRAAREALGASQDNVATAAGISPSYLSQLEQDERDPALSIAARLARALQISLDDLASGAA